MARSPIDWPATLRAHEEFLGIHLGFYDFKGRLGPLVGEVFLNHRTPACLRAKASDMGACKHFEGLALARVQAQGGVLWKCCHLGVTELLFELRSESGLEGVLFAGPFSKDHAPPPADVFRPTFPTKPDSAEVPDMKNRKEILPSVVRVSRPPAAADRVPGVLPSVVRASRDRASAYLHLLRPLVKALEDSLGRIPGVAGGRREDQVRHWLAKHYAAPDASVSSLASSIGLSPSAARAWLQKHFKKGFNELLTLRRMEMAELLLRWGDESLETIALQVGYEHARSFDKAFRRIHGTSPGRFRERAGKAV